MSFFFLGGGEETRICFLSKPRVGLFLECSREFPERDKIPGSRYRGKNRNPVTSDERKAIAESLWLTRPELRVKLCKGSPTAVRLWQKQIYLHPRIPRPSANHSTARSGPASKPPFAANGVGQERGECCAMGTIVGHLDLRARPSFYLLVTLQETHMGARVQSGWKHPQHAKTLN